jgi:hypothetical protein
LHHLLAALLAPYSHRCSASSLTPSYAATFASTRLSPTCSGNGKAAGAPFGSAQPLGVKDGIQQGDGEPPNNRLICGRVLGEKPQMARVRGVTLLIAGLLGLSGLAVLSYETYARTTITVGWAFSYGGIYAPRGSEMPMQIIDWWFGTSVAGSLLLASAVVSLLALFLASRTI